MLAAPARGVRRSSRTGPPSTWCRKRTREAASAEFATLKTAAMPKTNFTLNGSATTSSYEPGMNFLEVLREECRVLSPKNGCAPEGVCGCCAVLVDGQPVLSCLRKPEQMEGHNVVTLEGVDDELRRVLGEAFILEGAVQCGFCIPGIIVRASHLVREGRAGDRQAVAKALDGHLCRCTGYARILDAIQTAGEAWNNGRHVGPEPRRHFFFGEDYGMQRTTPLLNGHHEGGIGQSPSRYRGIEQALGDKPFIDDMFVPGMLRGAPVLSAHPRAKVLAIDTTEAAAMPGVVRIFNAPDVPGPRGTGLNYPDLPVFVAVGETTCCVGDMFALVVADTMFHARRAAEKVTVDYEAYEPVTDPFAALEPDAPQVHPPGNLFVHANLLDSTAFLRGDVDAALASSGGAFGAKEELSIQAQAAVAAFLLGRPVKVVLTRKESAQLHPRRHPMIMKYTVGADAEGHLLAVRARIIGDTGGYAGTGGKCLLRAACHSCGPYRVPNVDVESKA